MKTCRDNLFKLVRHVFVTDLVFRVTNKNPVRHLFVGIFVTC